MCEDEVLGLCVGSVKTALLLVFSGAFVISREKNDVEEVVCGKP